MARAAERIQTGEDGRGEADWRSNAAETLKPPQGPQSGKRNIIKFSTRNKTLVVLKTEELKMRSVVNIVIPGVESGSLSAVPQIAVARCKWTLSSGQHIKALRDRPPHSWTVSCSPTEHLLISENNKKVRGFHTDTLTITQMKLYIK